MIFVRGSILGLLFFLVYVHINDLPECLNHTPSRLFADNANLTVAGKTVDEVDLGMINDLACIKEWMLANKFSLNVAVRQGTPLLPDTLIDNKNTRIRLQE